ncbi:hypothetical protein HDZ31DRAFT_65305 [Schizophyllum fasciatum]
MSALFGQLLPAHRIRAPVEARPDSASKNGPSTNAIVQAKRQKAAEASEAIAHDMQELLDHVQAGFQCLADKYNKKVSYFQELFFQCGLHFSLIAANHRKEGEEGMTAIQIAQDETYRKQYSEMTDEQREDLVKMHDSMKDQHARSMQLSGRSSIQDAAFTFGQITSLIQGLQDCVGIEGFCVFARSKPTFYMKPWVFYSCKKLEDYLSIAVPQWDSVHVSTQIKSFSVSGCDLSSVFPTLTSAPVSGVF